MTMGPSQYTRAQGTVISESLEGVRPFGNIYPAVSVLSGECLHKCQPTPQTFGTITCTLGTFRTRISENGVLTYPHTTSQLNETFRIYLTHIHSFGAGGILGAVLRSSHCAAQSGGPTAHGG